MIEKIGTGKTGAPLVLAELNEAEKSGLWDILWLAETKVAEIRESGSTSARQFRPDGRRGSTLNAMISEIRRIYEIEA